MDTSAAESADVDSLGRRTGPRRQHTIEEKLRIVLETHVRGASVATVAHRHQVNPNQVFAWRQLYRRGLLDPGCCGAPADAAGEGEHADDAAEREGTVGVTEQRSRSIQGILQADRDQALERSQHCAVRAS